jgi:hypothetical protein
MRNREFTNSEYRDLADYLIPLGAICTGYMISVIECKNLILMVSLLKTDYKDYAREMIDEEI